MFVFLFIPKKGLPALLGKLHIRGAPPRKALQGIL
jgi:hypothetical protein